jgi:hypothetical protein
VPVTVSVYNNTLLRFLDGSNSPSDTYKVKLLTAATFDGTHATLAATGGTETANSFGYTTGGQALTNVAVSTVTTNDAKFDADDAVWTAAGGSITAAYAILYNASDAGEPPVAFVNFDAIESVSDGQQFRISWNANGIFTFTVT